MFCNKCGNSLNEGAKFCNKCGAPQHETTPPRATNPSPIIFSGHGAVLPEAPGSKKEATSWKLIKVSGILLTVCGIINLLILFYDLILYDLPGLYILMAIAYTAALVIVGVMGIQKSDNIEEAKFLRIIWWISFIFGGIMLWRIYEDIAFMLAIIVIPIELVYISGVEKNLKA